VTEPAGQTGKIAGGTVAAVNEDKVIADALHLGEGKFHFR
jgi:hypothetical protein